MSKSLNFLVIFVAVLLQLANHVTAGPPTEPTFRYKFCRPISYGNYTANSTYESNLEAVVSDLQAHASVSSFYDTSAGDGADTVYGQYYCRGDLNTSFCSDCIKAASVDALNCSNARAAIIWYKECTLRYKNESVFGVPEEDLTLNGYALSNMTDPDTLSSVLNETLTGLIKEAVSVSGGSSSVKYFATKATELSTFVTAYFLVQCSPDLNATQCESCLLFASGEMRTCCGEWPQAIYSSPPSCQVAYDTRDIFYFTPPAPPPPPSPPLEFFTPPPPRRPPPPPPPMATILPGTPPSINGGSSVIPNRNSMMFGITTSALVLLTIVFNI